MTSNTGPSQWFVLYTKPRNEKKVDDGIRQLGIESYCPVTRIRKKWSDRVKVVEEPLFRSYCFVRLEEKDRARVFAVPGVVRYLFWLQRPAVVRPEEIQAIKDMLAGHDHTRITVRSFLPEDRVTIKTGAFSDMEGRVREQRAQHLQVYLEALGVVVSVDMRGTLVE